MSTSQIAFFIGLFGSVHCIGMCGPLAFAIPLTTVAFGCSCGISWYITLGVL
ncbi:sulfite exporter TauE/SafE family protein [Mucilaginibacter metallidurans]|uniref:sulfite exporter TauE/SafE family protein n=1 Tax=Mucilaginibacter sp. P4 TaxID=3383180 RepID=UPI0021CEB5B6|nr:sulfite exporter TauE/SafE family protein [Mucilaginibacter gossypii]